MSRTKIHVPVGCTIILAVIMLICVVGLTWGLDFPGPNPGEAKAKIDGSTVSLENQAIALTWQIAGERFIPISLVDKLSDVTVVLKKTECFTIILDDSPSPQLKTVKASDLRLIDKPEIRRVEPVRRSLHAGDQFAGQQISATLRSTDGNLEVDWQAVLRDGANYVQQRVALRSRGPAAEVRQIEVLDLTAPKAEVMGVVDGSPVVASNLFFACEHPRSKSELLDASVVADGLNRFRCLLPCQVRLESDRPLVVSSVIGVVPAGQLRRGFLYYLERERPVPYRPFFHYNNGTEIGDLYWQKPREQRDAFRMDQERMWLENIHAFGRELVEKRNVIMDSFTHDYAWDDETLVWQFHKGYPQGFTPAREAAAKYNAHVSVWLSPWGGYPCKKARVEEGGKLGFETNRQGLSLAGPRYYARFSEACKNMIRRYGVDYFKFDGFGAGNNQPGAGLYGSDVDAMLRLISELRELKPDVFVNTSTGSWPSPFWLLSADSIWRQASDTGNDGTGSMRQKWISYRDGKILEGVLRRSPLYPVNSLMLHGIYINEVKVPNEKGIRSILPAETPEVIAEIRSFFGTGTSLQELYIEPKRMVPETWDVLAEAARWARANKEVLVDTHWIGGDPLKAEVYGFASWTPRKAILTLRNSNDQQASFDFDVAQAFELPKDAPQKYLLKSPWKEDTGKATISVTAGQIHRFALKPFEVLVFEAMPVMNTP
ncbi:MAG: enterotoxin [Kiritimatiellae bacterium]|nr:enterotoxin [Kiritimatiellia bacterium]